MPFERLLLGLFTIGAAARSVAAQELAVNDRGPRFLYAATERSKPQPVDVRNTPALKHRLKLNLDGATIPEALAVITEATGLAFVYNPGVVSPDTRVNLQVEQISVAAALTEILLDTQVDVLLSSPRQAALIKRPRAVPVVPAGTVQGRPISGVVANERGAGIAGAIVALMAGQARTTTDASGRFRLDRVAEGDVTLRVTAIGYRPAQQVVPARDSTVRIVLSESVINLDEVIVTGTAGGAEKRAIGNAIGRVAVTEAVEVAPPAKIQDVMATAVPGVQILRSEGQIGSGGRTRIRGSSSLSLSNEPLIYVDGVRVNNESSAPGSYLFISATSRVNDLNPEEIESIEILKGPSAATIYGTEASNGVIQIITKRGRQGRTTFDIHADAGAAWFMNPEGRYMPHAYIGADGEIHDFRVLDKNRELGFPSPFSTGTPVAFGASVSGGDQLRFFFSADANRDEGAVWNNWQNRYNARANLTYSTRDGKFGVDASLGALRSKTRGPGFQAIVEGITFACLFPGCEPDPANPSTTGWNDGSRGFSFYRPEDYETSEGWANVDRTTFSVKLTHRPFEWLRHQLTVGPDLVTNNTSTLVERVATARLPFFNYSLGYKAEQQQRSTYFTLDYGASVDKKFGSNLIATTSAGAQYYSKQFTTVAATGSIFSIPGPSDITGAAQRQATETFLENKTVGVYAQEQLAWKNRVFLTAAVRADDNSAFGSNFNAVYYPKFSASWVLSDEPFLSNSSLISQLRLRAAWGRAGLQPDVFSAIQTFQPKVGTGGAGGVSPQNFGNPDLKPEVGEETEAGFDLEMGRGRVGFEFTFYNKNVKDAILSAPLKPSGGFPGNQFINIGKTRNRGIELGLNVRPVESENVALDLRTTFATNDSKIIDLGGFPPLLAGLGSPLFGQYNVAGFAPASLFYKKVLGSTVQKIPFGGKEIPVGHNPICEGGTDLGEGDGTEVPCLNAPRLYRGRPTPSWNGSVSATLTLWKRLRLFGLVEGLGGNTIMSCDAACSAHFYFQTRTVLDGSDPVLAGYIGMYLLEGDATNVWGDGLFKAGFAKLRTISASYDFPNRIARFLGASRGSITMSAENLAILWWEQREAYGYRWVDPEVMPYGGDVAFNQENWPQLARFRTTIRLTF